MNTFNFDATPIVLSEAKTLKISQRCLKRHFSRIAHGLYVPNSLLETSSPHKWPLELRALAIQKIFPNCAISGFAALHARGVPHIDPLTPISFWTTSTNATRDHKFNAIPRRVSALPPCDNIGELRVVPVADSVVDAIRAIETGSASWWVPNIPGMKWQQIRIIQVIDAARKYASLTWEDLEAAGRKRIRRQLLKEMWAFSDPGADSPPETHLRLAVRDLAEWVSQRVFQRSNGVKLTAADLADEDSKVALFYDGEHHLQRAQRDHDSEVLQQLRMQGWEPVRVTAGQMRNIPELRRRIQHFMDRASR
ncbi:hypothetical protein QVA66_10245 [Staphylococcus chromogenes]|nr:hypothetical protein [Staphylococcus chromogenes]